MGMDGHSHCVSDGEHAHCEPDMRKEHCDYGCEVDRCVEMTEDGYECQWKDMGPGMCRGDYGYAPNFSANGFDMDGCASACEETEGCMGISLSRGGRCAMWMKELPTYEHAVFGSGHAGENWSSDMKLTTVNDDDRWHCAIMMCDREREGCEGDMMEMKRKMEMMEENQDFLHRMFEDCLVRDLEVTECHDEANWVDN